MLRALVTAASSAAFAVLPIGGAPAAQPAAPQSTITVQNPSALPRAQWFTAAVPFGRGARHAVDDLHVAGRPTAWRILQRWPDGSVRVAQAQFFDALQGYESRRLTLDAGALPPPPFALHPAVAAAATDFAVATVVRDRDGVPYGAATRPLASAGAEVLERTAAVHTLRTRTYHTHAAGRGIGRDFLSHTVYTTLFSGVPCAVVDVVVANDYLGADAPATADPNQHALGDVAFASVDLVCGGGETYVQYARQNGIRRAVALGADATWVPLLPAGHFADGQGKRWRAVVWFGGELAEPERRQSRLSAAAMADASAIPLVDHASWHAAGAFGIHRGPVAGPADAIQRAQDDYRSWLRTADWGPYGAWGGVKQSFAGGSVRNGPLTELGAHAIQTGLCLPLLQLEAQSWQETLRPLHLWGLRVDPSLDVFLWDPLPYTRTSHRQVSRETLGRRRLVEDDPWAHWRIGVAPGDAHGWNGYDPEHFSLDLLFDYWTLTGDHRSRDEIVNMAESAMAITRPTGYASAEVQPARVEGWIAQALVKAWFATGDDRYIDHIRHRIATIVEPGRHVGHPSRALYFEPTSGHTPFPTPHRFYMAWQHASVVYGYLPLWELFGDATARQIAHDVLQCVAHSWARDVTSAKFGRVAEGLRYQTPTELAGVPVPPDVWDATPGIGPVFGESPLGGTAMFLVGALDLIREDMEDAGEAARALAYRSALLLPTGPADDKWRWFRWCFLRESPTR